ncbi:MAG: hypothetical protein ACXACX_00205 [Candidatus Hodarchaeales archaeon]|jgi:hypothetical protein
MKINRENDSTALKNSEPQIIENLRITIDTNFIEKSLLNGQIVIDGQNEPIILNAPNFSLFSRNRVTIANLTILNAPGSVIENQVFDGVYLNLTNSPNSIIRNNIIKNIIQTSSQWEGVGIYLQNSSNTFITGNDIDNIFSENSASLGILALDSKSLRIIDNLITGVGASDNAGVSGSYGIRIDSGSDHSIIADNNLNNINSQFAPVFGIMTALVNNVTIHNNFISSVMISSTSFPIASGIHVTSSSDVLLESNVIEIIESNTVNNLAFSYGINIENSFVTIINNEISGIFALSSSETHAYGISSDTSFITAVNNRISNVNSLGISQGNSYGVYLLSVNDTLFDGPNIVDNINGNNRSNDFLLERSYNNSFVFIENFVYNIAWKDTFLPAAYSFYQIFQNGIELPPPGPQAWNPTDKINISVIGLPIGNWDHEIILTGGGPNIVIPINISIVENFSPQIVGPSDITLEEGATDILLSWNITDSEPGNYTVLLNNNKNLDGFWNSGQIVSINTGDLIVGTYNYTLLATDMYLMTNIHSVIVFVVDTIAPTILGPDVLEIEERVNDSIVWDISDRNLENVFIFMNNETVFNNSWVFDTTLNFTLVELPVGEYNLTVQAIDASGNSATETTFVYALDTTAPAVNGPSRVLVKEGEQGKKIEWEVFDWNPRNYSIYRNNLQLENGSWEGLRTIYYSLDDLPFGIWNFTLILQDLYNQSSSNSVTVSVSTGGVNTTTTDIPGFDDATIFIVGAAIGVGIVVVGGIVLFMRRR